MSLRRRGVFAPKILIPLLAAGAVGIGAVGVMSLLARRGEAAISMIPSDALVAISFDNTPSASQVPLFNEIKAAMEDSGMNDLIDNMLEQFDPKGGTIKRIRSHIRGSFAFGMWGDISKGEPEVICAIALNDVAGAENLLGNFPEVRRRVDKGLRYYSTDDSPGIVTFYGDYAVAASTLSAAHKAVSVAEGKESSLYEEAEFKQARQSLPSDASLMVFVNGAGIAKADDETREIYKSLGVTPEGWVAWGMTLRSEGIVFNGYEPGETAKEFRKEVLETPALSYRSLDKFPGGAIGVFGVSSPGSIGSMLLKVFRSVPDAEELHAGLDEVEKTTGTSVDKDWILAFKGELFFALYPPSEPKGDPGVIVSIDSSNGGTPTKLLDKMYASAKAGKFDDGGKGPELVTSQMGAMTVYRDANAKDSGFLGVVDGQVMLFSKTDLAKRASDGSGESLLDDDGWRNFGRGEPAQIRMQIDMHRLFDMIEAMGEMPEDINLRQVLAAREMTMWCRWDEKAAITEMLIPINIPELIRVVGKQAREAQANADRESELKMN